jgi:uncharacterized heparinase superfamily protein
MSLPRLARTVRWLKPVQIYGRILHHAPRPEPRRAPPPALRRPRAVWREALLRPSPLRGPARVRHLNHEVEIDAPGAWNDPAQSRLWLYNLHYFQGFSPLGEDEHDARLATLIERWVAENPPGHGVGWEPYPTSLRIVNWIKRHLAGGSLSPAVLASLAHQVRWLAGRLEWRLLGNHLLANAKALMFAGLFFEGAEAERWRTRGLGILRAQLAEQILADGGHFERSPMYHALVLEDVLDLLNLARTYATPEEDWARLIGRMLAWQANLTHPDGRIAFFNDAAFGVAGDLDGLEDYALRLGLAPPARPGSGVWMGASGYGRLATDEAVVLLDAAPIGPDHLPGHAHADTLSFEWSLGPDRVVVNGGTSLYSEGADRARERATASHSTVEIDGLDSSELWSGFRAGRRARVQGVEVVRDEAGPQASAVHDGYAWRPGRPRHRRDWRLSSGRLDVTDRIDGRADKAEARFHLAPTCRATLHEDGRSGSITTPAGRIITWSTSAPARLEHSEWRPEFGLRQATTQLVVQLDAPRLRTQFTW